MSDKHCMLYCKEYKAWFGLEGSKSQINNWGFDFSHIDDLSFALVSNKDDAYVFDEYGDDVEKIIDDLRYDEDIRLKRVWVENPEEKTVTGEQDLEAEDKEKLDALADEIIDHCFMEHFKYSEIKKMVENRDESLWDKLLRHGHSELFDDNEEKLLDDFISDHRDELFDLLEEKLDECADEYEDEEDDDDYDDDYDEEDDDYDDEDDMDESFRIRSRRKNTIEEAFKLLRSPKKKINEDTKKFEDKDAEEEYFRHIQELSTDYEDPDAEEYEEDDYDEEDDIEESCTLKESNDIVTAVFKDNGFDKGEFEEAYPELMSRLEFDTRKFDNRENQLAYCDIYVKGKREDVEDFIQKSIWDYGCDTKEEAEELYGEGCIPTIIENESLNEDANQNAKAKYNKVLNLLDKSNIEYDEDEDPKQIFDDECMALVKINGEDALGLFKAKLNGKTVYDVYAGEELLPVGKKSAEDIFKLITNKKYESLKEDAKFVTAATILKKDQNKIFAQTTEEGMRRMVLDILDKNKDKMKPENYSKVVKTMKNCPKSAVPSTVWTMLNPSQKVGK